MAIGNVAISENPTVKEQVTLKITLDNFNKAADHGKTLKVTIDEFGARDYPITDSGIVVVTFTPQHAGTYGYMISKVSGSGVDKSGSITVTRGLSFGPTIPMTVDGSGNLLALADGYSRVTLKLAAMDDDGNIVNVNYRITLNGLNTTYVKDSRGMAYLTVGPYGGSDLTPIAITVSADGYTTKTLHIRFIKGTIQISTNVSGTPPMVTPGSMIEVVAQLKDNGNPIARTPVIFREIMSNGSSYTGTYYTDDFGNIEIECPVGPKAGNNIFSFQLKGLSLVNAFSVRTVTSALADFSISALPAANVISDGVSRHKIIAQITDAYGNNIKDSAGVDVTFTNEYGSSYTTQPNSRGVAYAWSEPSNFPGRLNYTIRVDAGSWNLTKDYTVYYVVNDPDDMVMNAYPATIASSNVRNSNITYAMNQSTIVTRIVDVNGHPVAFKPVNLTLVNTSQGTLTPDNGMTDAGGEFSSVFRLASTLTGSGTVGIQASCAGTSLSEALSLTYTEDSHLNISTNVDPRQVKPGDMVNVTVEIDGVGWDNGRPPADVMLVMDRSGSMGDAIGFTNYAANDNGGWFGPTVYDNLTNPVAKGTTGDIIYNHNIATRLLFKVSQASPPYPKADAQWVTDNIPTEMIAGRTYTGTVTFKNIGDVIWSNTNKTLLADKNNGPFLSSNKSYMSSNVNTLNGEQYTFTFTMTAPMVYAVTTYTVNYSMQWNTFSGWFGDYVSHKITVNPDPEKMPNAEYVSDTIPADMVCGEFYDVSVTFKNTGNIDWTRANNTRLIYYGGDNPYFWLTSSYPDYRLFYIPTGVSVKNGETYTFNFTMRGAITSAKKTFTNAWYRMYSDTYNYFGQQLTHKINVTTNAAALPNATVNSVNIPEVMIAGQTYPCSITLMNTGGLPWSNLNLTRLISRGDNPTFGVTDSIYVPAGTTVMPGSTYTFNFNMKAPNVMAMTNYTNAWYTMYMDYALLPSSGWFGSANPIYTFPKITVLPVPRAPPVYGDWYSYKMIYMGKTSNTTLVTGNADVDLASPNWASTIKVIPTSATPIPAMNSSGAGFTNGSYAVPGMYDLQITNTYAYANAPEVGYNVWIWDNMKMGQRCDQDAMAKLAAKNFIDPTANPRNIYPADRVGMVTFGTDATMDLPLKYMTGANISNTVTYTGLKEMISGINSYGETNTAAALDLAVNEFKNNTNPDKNATRHIILLTDGYSTSTAAQNDFEVDRIISEKIKVYAIGIADDESKVDSTFLQNLATRSGGRYFFVKDMPQLLDAYNIIGQMIKETITDQSMINITIPQTIAGVNDVTYVPGSAYVIKNKNPATLRQVEPTVSDNTLGWVVDPIKLGTNWTLTYKVRANVRGFTHPVDEGSVGHFALDNQVTDENFMSEAIYVNDNNVSANDMLDVNITMPDEGTDIVDSGIDMRWNVRYNATPLSYSQIIEYAPYGTDNYVPIISGFKSSVSNPYRYLIDLDKLNIKPGEYTFKIYATDGLFESYDVRNLTIVYEHGPINGYITIGSKK